jgi:hypothetical protein
LYSERAELLSPSPILGDFELRIVVKSSKACPELVEGLGGWVAKNSSSQTRQYLHPKSKKSAVKVFFF